MVLAPGPCTHQTLKLALCPHAGLCMCAWSSAAVQIYTPPHSLLGCFSKKENHSINNEWPTEINKASLYRSKLYQIIIRQGKGRANDANESKHNETLSAMNDEKHRNTLTHSCHVAIWAHSLFPLNRILRWFWTLSSPQSRSVVQHIYCCGDLMGLEVN